MVLDDDWVNWPHAIGWSVAAWAATGLAVGLAVGLATRFGLRLPVGWDPLFLIVPLLAVVFMAGVYEHEIWWRRASLLVALPPAAFTLFTVVWLARQWDADNPGMGFAVLVVVMAAVFTVGIAVAAFVVAALGVWAGQRRAKRDSW